MCLGERKRELLDSYVTLWMCVCVRQRKREIKKERRIDLFDRLDDLTMIPRCVYESGRENTRKRKREWERSTWPLDDPHMCVSVRQRERERDKERMGVGLLDPSMTPLWPLDECICKGVRKNDRKRVREIYLTSRWPPDVCICHRERERVWEIYLTLRWPPDMCVSGRKKTVQEKEEQRDLLNS